MNFTETLKTQKIHRFVKKQRENKKFLKSLELSGTFFLIAFFGLFAIKPAITTISGLIGDIKAKEQLTVKLRERIKNIIQAQENYALIQEKYSVIESSLPEGYHFFNSSSQFRASFIEQNVASDRLVYGFSDTQKQSVKNLQTYNIKTGGQADFSQIVGFVDKILGVRRLMDIDQINFSIEKDAYAGSQSEASASGGLKFNINADVFYWEEEK